MNIDEPAKTITRAQHPRWLVWSLGIVCIGAVFALQSPSLLWTIRVGHDHGFRSGKASYMIAWSTLTLMANASFVTAWCLLRPRHRLAGPVFAGLLLFVWLLLFPVTMFMSALLHQLA